MTYRAEFPDFPQSPEAADLLARGFVDHSWHNDVCPRFHDAADLLCVWIDYPDAADREADTPRFLVHSTALLEGEHVPMLYEGDDWASVLQAVRAALAVGA
jgi:hypothetical protein